MKENQDQEQLLPENKPIKPTKFEYQNETERLKDYSSLCENNKFKEPKLVNVDFIKPLNIFLSALICLSFYLLIYIIILKPNTFSIILFVIIFFIGHFAQSQVIPEFPSFKSKEEFSTKIKEILNSKVILKDENNTKISSVKYTIDVTGQIGIPEDIKLIKFDEVIILIEKNVCEKFKNKKLKYEIYFEEKRIAIPEEIYYLSKPPISHPVNGLTIILSLFLLQWIQALYYILNWKMVVIYQNKLAISEKKEFDRTKINVHGDEYISNGIIENDLEQNEIIKKHTNKMTSINQEESIASSSGI